MLTCIFNRHLQLPGRRFDSTRVRSVCTNSPCQNCKTISNISLPCISVSLILAKSFFKVEGKMTAKMKKINKYNLHSKYASFFDIPLNNNKTKNVAKTEMG